MESIKQKGIARKIERNKRFQAELNSFRPLSFLHGGSRNANDDIIERGTLIRIKNRTLLEDDFKVEAELDGVRVDVIASREDIIGKNISLLLDFYEEELKLKDVIKR